MPSNVVSKEPGGGGLLGCLAVIGIVFVSFKLVGLMLAPYPSTKSSSTPFQIPGPKSTTFQAAGKPDEPKITDDPATALQEYYRTFSLQDFKTAFSLRSSRTRSGYSLKKFKQSWGGPVELTIANLKNQSPTTAVFSVGLHYTGPLQTERWETGEIRLTKEKGRWLFDGGELSELKPETKVSQREDLYSKGEIWGRRVVDEWEAAGNLPADATDVQYALNRMFSEMERGPNRNYSPSQVHEWKQGAISGAKERFRELNP